MRRSPRPGITPVEVLVVGALALILTACDGPKEVQVPVGTETMGGVFWPSKDSVAPALLLLHPAGGSQEDWAPVLDSLHEAGYGLLTVNLRDGGQGELQLLEQDVRAGFEFLRLQKKVDSARITLLGAGMSADAAFLVAADDPLIKTVVLLSPELGVPDDRLGTALGEYGYRPLLVVTSPDGESSTDAAEVLRRGSRGEVVVHETAAGSNGQRAGEVLRGRLREVLAFLGTNL